MPLTFEFDPSITRELRDGLSTLWRDVTNAGGAVGFVPPVTADDIRPDLLNHLVAVDAGRTRMMVGWDGKGQIVASAFLTFNAHMLKQHWCTVYTVMLHPALQGKGYGRDLMSEIEKEARGTDGIEALRLSCRGGLALEQFYLSCGYREVGRLPGAIQVADHDFRDDVIFWLALG